MGAFPFGKEDGLLKMSYHHGSMLPYGGQALPSGGELAAPPGCAGPEVTQPPVKGSDAEPASWADGEAYVKLS